MKKLQHRHHKLRRRRCNASYTRLESRHLLTGISLEVFHGLATVIIDGSSGDDTSEVIDLNPTDFRVTLNGQQQSFSRSEVERIRFLGRSGDDFFANHTDIDSAAFGHNGNDTIRGGDGHNWIQGGNGNDLIFGGDRNDRLRGRAGDDTIDPGRRHDRVFGGDGDDEVVASHGNDRIFGEDGADSLYGGDGTDTIHGGNGWDVIDGGNGDDDLTGGSGNDQISGGNGHDLISGNSGNDTLRGNVGNDQIFGDNGDDLLFGDAGFDDLRGSAGDDRIRGGTGNDLIRFGPGSSEAAMFQGEFGDYTIVSSGVTLQVNAHSASDGMDTIWQPATLRFEDLDRAAADFFVDLNEAETESLRLLNQLRNSVGLEALTAVVDLSDYAENWSRHTLPHDFRHSTASEIEHLFVHGRTVYGENIVFYGDSSLSALEAAQLFHQAWVDSPTHSDNMIDGRWTEIGLGLVRLPTGWYGTHSFANA